MQTLTMNGDPAGIEKVATLMMDRLTTLAYLIGQVRDCPTCERWVRFSRVLQECKQIPFGPDVFVLGMDDLGEAVKRDMAEAVEEPEGDYPF